MNEEIWNEELLRQSLPNYLVDHITSELPNREESTTFDKAWWLCTINDKFIV